MFLHILLIHSFYLKKKEAFLNGIPLVVVEAEGRGILRENKDS